MITGEDIERCEEEQDKVSKQLVVIDNMQFFELEIPADQDPYEFLNSQECREECAARILNHTTDLTIDRVYTRYDPIKEEWCYEEA